VYPKEDHQRKDLRNKTSPLIHRSLGDEVEETRVMMTENSTQRSRNPSVPVGSAFLPKTREVSWEVHVPLWNVSSGLAAFPPFQSERASKEALGFASSPL
jgi:hypothetical protein